jgi:predicted N-acetyltransferase YhbS
VPYGDGTEADYLDGLRGKDTFLPELSFVALKNKKIVGQIVLYQTDITTPTGPRTELVLTPLSVEPAHFRRGIARALTEHALAKARALGYRAVFLCGDPEIYARLGFVPTAQYKIYHVQEAEAPWSMVRELYEDALAGIEGTVDTI